MPKKFFRRLSPKPEVIKKHPALRLVAPLLNDPNMFHLNRYSVSMAFLIGVFLAFFPLPGQMLLAATVAFWVRCNLPIAVALVWITNPITIPPIFFATYKLGTWLLEMPSVHMSGPLSLQMIAQKLAITWQPLLLGSLCAGSFFSLLSYFLVRYLWRLHVIFQWHRRKHKRRH